MRYQFAKLFVTGGLWLGLLALHGQAQIQMPHGPSGPTTFDQEVDAFAPAEMDLDGMVIGRENRVGYFFNYDFTYWSITGERTVVGNRNVQRDMPPVWMDRIRPINPFSGLPIATLMTTIDPVTGRPINPDTNNPIQRPVFINSIEETKPDASFRNGDRIDFGFTSEGNGWMVSILSGPKQQQSQIYGNGGGFLEDTAPPGLLNPFGNVYIAFAYQEGLMDGFVDVVDGNLGLGRVLDQDMNGDGIADGDGFADDLDGDGQFGPDGFDTAAPAGIPDASPAVGLNGEIQTQPPDYDDLVELPTSFRFVTVQNATTISGIELMGTYRLDNRHLMAKNQNNIFDIYYGVRYLRFRDEFFVSGVGGVLGASFWDTQIINNIVGPQLGLNWQSERGRWRSNLTGRFTFGYNVSNWDQDGSIGDNLAAGRLNRPLYLQQHAFKYGRRDDNFSPIAELRWNFAYQITKQIAINAGWTGGYIGNVYRSSTHIKYELPNMGFTLNDAESVIYNGGNIGIEYNF